MAYIILAKSIYSHPTVILLNMIQYQYCEENLKVGTMSFVCI